MPANENPFRDLHTFCAFIGNTRSGHSLVGALIDAHPNAIIPHEFPIFGEDEEAGTIAFPNRKKLFKQIIRKSSKQAETGRSGWRRKPGGRYKVSYAVPNQYQGRFEELNVIGTKFAQETAEAFHANERVLDELREMTRLELKLINVVRNPYDNIASMARNAPPERRKARLGAIERYMFRTRMVKQAKERGYPVLDVFLEDMIEQPQPTLSALVEFIGLEPRDDYLHDCAGVVEGTPNETRHGHGWSDEELALVEQAVAEFPWLERYREALPVASA